MTVELIKELTTELDSSSETIAKLILALESAEAENKRLRTTIDGQETERTIREAYIRKLERESGEAGEE